MILTTVKVLLTLSDDSKDQILDTLIRSMKQKVMNYCNRVDVPVALEDIIAEMVVALYKSTYGVVTIASGATVPSGSVKSESIGDYSVTYNTSSSSSSSSITESSTSILSDYKAQLQKFRKLKL